MSLSASCNFWRHFLLHLMLLVGYVMLNVPDAGATTAESGFTCQGYNTIIYSGENKLIAVCHGQYAEFNRKRIESWQDCYDSTIYARDKNKDLNTVVADCSPIRYTQFRLINGVLDIKYYYDLYSSVEQEPFVLRGYDVSDSSSDYKIIADLEAYTKSEIREAVQLMAAELKKPFDGKTYFNVIYSSFDKIRAYAAVDPDFSMRILNNYATRQVFDGEASERLSSTIDDVELIKLAKTNGKLEDPNESDRRVKGDINCDGEDDVASIVHGNKKVKVMVTFSDGAKSNELEFGFGESIYQSSLCGNEASLSPEKLNDLSEMFGENPEGYKTSETCIGLRLSGGECDSMHIFWNHKTNQLNWWRL